jgi:hypothetical protein
MLAQWHPWTLDILTSTEARDEARHDYHSRRCPVNDPAFVVFKHIHKHP